MKYFNKNRIELLAWHLADKIMAWLIKKEGGIPFRTWNAILKQPWFFSHRQQAEEKVGARRVYNFKTKKFQCVVIK